MDLDLVWWVDLDFEMGSRFQLQFNGLKAWFGSAIEGGLPLKVWWVSVWTLIWCVSIWTLISGLLPLYKALNFGSLQFDDKTWVCLMRKQRKTNWKKKDRTNSKKNEWRMNIIWNKVYTR